jgi:hypothetical protein
MKLFSALACALCLAGCASRGPSPQAVAALNEAIADCRAEGGPHVARSRCINAAEDHFLRAGNPNPDLLDLLQAMRVSLAEKVDAGIMSDEDAQTAFAKARSDAISEARRRSLNAEAVEAQERAAFQASLPVTCFRTGDMTNCY